MSDILERMKNNQKWLIRDGFETSAKNMEEAIKEITKLRAQVAEQADEIAKLRDALSETEAYHKRMMAAKDAEFAELKGALEATEKKVITDLREQVQRQAALIEQCRDALKELSNRAENFHAANVYFPEFEVAKNAINAAREALAAIASLQQN